MSIDYKMMGKRIKVRRKELNLTQKELTEKAGLNDKYISNIERATSIPSIDTLVSICKALDISVDFILNGLTNENIEISTFHKIVNLLNLMNHKDQQFVLEFLELYYNRIKN